MSTRTFCDICDKETVESDDLDAAPRLVLDLSPSLGRVEMLSSVYDDICPVCWITMLQYISSRCDELDKQVSSSLQAPSALQRRSRTIENELRSKVRQL